MFSKLNFLHQDMIHTVYYRMSFKLCVEDPNPQYWADGLLWPWTGDSPEYMSHKWREWVFLENFLEFLLKQHRWQVIQIILLIHYIWHNVLSVFLG